MRTRPRTAPVRVLVVDHSLEQCPRTGQWRVIACFVSRIEIDSETVFGSNRLFDSDAEIYVCCARSAVLRLAAHGTAWRRVRTIVPPRAADADNHLETIPVSPASEIGNRRGSGIRGCMAARRKPFTTRTKPLSAIAPKIPLSGGVVVQAAGPPTSGIGRATSYATELDRTRR